MRCTCCTVMDVCVRASCVTRMCSRVHLCVCVCKRLCLIFSDVQVLLELGRFAFTMLVRKLLVFDQEMITEYQLSDRAIQAGLLILNDTSLGSRQYRFYSSVNPGVSGCIVHSSMCHSGCVSCVYVGETSG